MEIQLPQKVQFIIETLNQAGFEAYAVGGCVRDSILGRKPDDWDITTSARPEEVKALFERTVDTGLQHGTVTVLLERDSYEVTTYRIDGEYLDGRHPECVSFTSSLKEDLRRRDFTINAMAYSRETGLVDCFEGLEDIRLKRVRCVGDPGERFSEDALRILRAVRFSAQLGFSVEDKTQQAIRELAPALGKISAERIRTELGKLLVSQRPDKLGEAWKLGITRVVLPEFDRAAEEGREKKILEGLRRIQADPIRRWSLLLGFLGEEEEARSVLKRLRFDNDTVRQVCALIRAEKWTVEPEPASVRRAVSRIGVQLFPLYLDLCQVRAQLEEGTSGREREENNRRIRELFAGILEKGDCVSLKQLKIGGRDLIAAGFQPGPRVGSILETLLDRVLECPELNTKEQLLELAEK